MGIYGEQILPRVINVACGMKVVQPLRRRFCEGLAGDVVEIGFGSGHNVPFYPAAVTRVAAVEPANLGWKLADGRLRATTVPVARAGLDGQSLPFEDDSYDAALSTWTLCTVPDADGALSASCDGSSSPVGRCTSSSMEWLRTSECAAGNTASTRCSRGSSAAVTSRAQSSSC